MASIEPAQLPHIPTNTHRVSFAFCFFHKKGKNMFIFICRKYICDKILENFLAGHIQYLKTTIGELPQIYVQHKPYDFATY